jgi:phosphomevalonate kinase
MPHLRLHVDSSAFFGPDGAKLGLGSSAAVAVGTAQALLRYSGLEPGALEDSTLRAALDGHRSRQGGIGSGYDIAASLYGGCGLFTGGATPSFEPIVLPWMPPFSLVRGAAPVDTSGAVGRYMEWKKRNPQAARDFLEASNEVARSFAGAGNWTEASSLLMEGARLGVELGEAIGVSARIAGLDGREGKALGAGNEVGALWREDSETKAGGFEDLAIATAGPLWRE